MDADVVLIETPGAEGPTHLSEWQQHDRDSESSSALGQSDPVLREGVGYGDAAG